MNWPRILADLKAGGYSQRDLQDVLQCSQSAISRLLRGKRFLKFSEGMRLLDLHAGRPLSPLWKPDLDGLPWYVYALVDPRTGKVFYIGKGKDDRKDAHEKQALRGDSGAKCEVIRAIWKSGLQVEKRLIGLFLTSKAARDFETRTIHEYGYENLTNRHPWWTRKKHVSGPANPA